MSSTMISNYDPNRQLQYTIYVCESGNVTGFEVLFDVPQSLVDFRPERVFMGPIGGIGVPSMQRQTAPPAAPCSGCKGGTR